MSAKVVIILCIQTLLAQVVFGQCVHSGGDYVLSAIVPTNGVSSCRSLGSESMAYRGGCGLSSGLGIGSRVSKSFTDTGLSSANIQSIATSGGSLPIQSFSTIASSGISVASENAYEGSLNVIGELPFLSTVALEGVLPSGGSGIINYGCGNGVTAITSEALNSVGTADLGSAAFGNGRMGNGLGLSSTSAGSANLGYGGGRVCGCGL